VHVLEPNRKRRVGKLERRLPPISELIRFVGPTLLPRKTNRWARVRTVADFESLARRRTPPSIFDYVEGAADLELAREGAVAAFARTVFHPHVLRNMSVVDTSVSILRRPALLPVVLGPTGFTRMMHAAGEPAVARAAGRAGIPYALSTLGTTSIERLTREAPTTERWFQLYIAKDRGRTNELISCAAEHGYSTVELDGGLAAGSDAVLDTPRLAAAVDEMLAHTSRAVRTNSNSDTARASTSAVAVDAPAPR
jgi:L-lactate dehydrogenase (cytochrome)